MCRTGASCGCGGGGGPNIALGIAAVAGLAVLSLAVSILAALAPELWAAAGVVFALVAAAGALIVWQARRLTRPAVPVRPVAAVVVRRALPASPLAIEAGTAGRGGRSAFETDCPAALGHPRAPAAAPQHNPQAEAGQWAR